MTDTRADLPTVDLSECEQEPIHLLELVQGHGCLAVVRGPDLRIVQISDNAASILGHSTKDVLGSPLPTYLDGLPLATLDALRDDTRRPESASIGVYARPRDPAPGVLRLRITAHRRCGEASASAVEQGEPVPDPNDLIIELEPVVEKDEDAAEDTFEAESIALASLTEGENLFHLLHQAVHAIAGLTDYDRVMAYMFHEDWSGEVVAEICHPDMTPYLGLRYPASDIPAQARRLYLSQVLRVIVDVDGLNVPVVRDPSLAQEPPLDLGGAILRSVSSYHIEYLRNMGVKGTLVASVIVDGALWGLIACHHNTRKVVPWHRREAVARVTARLSDRITDILSLQRTRRQRRAKRYLSLLAQALVGHVNPVQALLFETPRLSDLVRCHGVALVANGCIVTGGEAPTPDVLAVLLDRARALATDGVFVSHDLPGDRPFADLPLGSSCGMVAVFPPDREGLTLVCFRGEVVREVHWGGDPNKPVEVDSASQRLSPRKSFNLWREVVRGQSSPWEPWAVDLLRVLGARLAEHADAVGASLGLKQAIRAQLAGIEATVGTHVETLYVADSGLLLVDVTAESNPASPASDVDSNVQGGARDRSSVPGAGNRVVAANQTFRWRFDVDEADLNEVPVDTVLRQLGLPRAIAELPPGGDMEVEWWSGSSGHRTLQVHRRGLFAYSDTDGAAEGGECRRRAWATYTFNDVTSFYRTRRALGVARDQAQARSRGRTEFLARLAQELRGPLQAIQGYAELLENDDEPVPPDRYRSFAHEIGNNSGTLLNLLNNLLDLSRLDQVTDGSASDSFDLTMMTTEICQQVAPAAARGGLTWDWHMPNERILFQGDEGALRRAFVTLIRKAVIASPAGSTVIVRLTMERGGEPRLSVSDTGLGLTDEELLALQRPLEVRPDDGTLEEDKLGSVSLALVRGLIDLHGGAIVVASNPGSGTTVNVTLPRHRVVARDNAGSTSGLLG